eukprot:jgi/Hompol1/3360/HPOL_006500-RA
MSMIEFCVPMEVRLRIYEHAGALTQQRHGLLPQPLTETAFCAVLIDAFRLDDLGFVASQPRGVVLDVGLMFVRSLQMAPLARRFQRPLAMRPLGVHLLNAQSPTPDMVLDLLHFLQKAPTNHARLIAHQALHIPSVDALELAAMNGHTHIIKWLCSTGRDRRVSAALCGAIMGGQLDIARFLCSRYPHLIPSQYAVVSAIEFGRLDVIWWLLCGDCNDS